MLVAPAFSGVDPSSAIQKKELRAFFPLSSFARFTVLPTRLTLLVTDLAQGRSLLGLYLC